MSISFTFFSVARVLCVLMQRSLNLRLWAVLFSHILGYSKTTLAFLTSSTCNIRKVCFKLFLNGIQCDDGGLFCKIQSTTEHLLNKRVRLQKSSSVAESQLRECIDVTQTLVSQKCVTTARIVAWLMTWCCVDIGVRGFWCDTWVDFLFLFFYRSKLTVSAYR